MLTLMSGANMGVIRFCVRPMKPTRRRNLPNLHRPTRPTRIREPRFWPMWVPPPVVRRSLKMSHFLPELTSKGTISNTLRSSIPLLSVLLEIQMNASIYRVVPVIVVSSLLGVSFPSETRGDEKIVERLRGLGAEFERDDEGTVVAVDFGFQPLATDSDLALLKGLAYLAEVTMSEMKFTDAGLKHIASLPSLKRLDLSYTKFTDADLKYLDGLTVLEELDLSGTAITDASIPSLTNLQGLKYISLSSTRVTPDGLRLLRSELPNLYVDESWNYMASFVDGRGVLDTDRVTFVFEGIRGPKGAGGGGGGSIKISKPQSDDVATSSSGGGGGGFGFGTGAGAIGAFASREKGIPTIRVGKHRIEIMNEGTEVVIDGQSFHIRSKKERIIVSKDGVARLEEWQSDDSP